MNTPTKIPHISKELVEYLDKAHPEASPVPGKTIDELMFNGGRRELIRWLLVQYYRQEKESSVGGLEEIKLK